MLVVGNLKPLPRFYAEHAGQMTRLFTAQFGRAAANRLHEESAPSQASIVTAVQSFLMIALLRGVLLEKHPNQAIVETGGVGYDVAIPVSTFTQLPRAGDPVLLRIHT